MSLFSAQKIKVNTFTLFILAISVALFYLADELPSENILGETYDGYQVTKVVDGDTVKLDLDGQVETIRLIGVDTPETVHPNKEVECYGKEASDYLKSLIDGEYVDIELDPTQGERDKYGRLLAYLWRSEDNLFINKALIENGYAHEYTYELPYKHQTSFLNAQSKASSAQIGLWGDICNNSPG